MANTCELSINVVTVGGPKMLTGPYRSGYRGSDLPCHGQVGINSPLSANREGLNQSRHSSETPARLILANRSARAGTPVSLYRSSQEASGP